MGRKHRDRQAGAQRDEAPFERSLAAAEADVAVAPEASGGEADTRCPCGSREFLLEAYLHVVDGLANPEPVEVETLTCPACGREFEAVQGESGRFLRGDLLGFAELDDD